MKKAISTGRQGFTLIEILIVISILAILMVMAVAVLNPAAQTNKANDARRKNDLNQIKIAFEEYVNDKGCYPTEAVVNGLSCGDNFFAPQGLNSWPCDPVTKVPYYFSIDSKSCPSWYAIMTNLNNKSDSQIPKDWYKSGSGYNVGDGLSTGQVNFGVSSPNVLWYNQSVVLPAICSSGIKECYSYDPNPAVGFTSVGGGIHYNSYTNNCSGCEKVCLVDCCNDGAICQ